MANVKLTIACVAALMVLILAETSSAGRRDSRSKKSNVVVEEEKAPEAPAETKLKINVVQPEEKAPEATAPVSGDAAVVNGVGIPAVELERELFKVRQQMASRGMPPGAVPKEVEDRALEHLIDRELLYQECTKRNIVVEDKEIEDEITTIKNTFPSVEVFVQTLAERGMTEDDVRAEITKGMHVQRFVSGEFLDKAKVQEKDIKKFYDGNQNMFREEPQVKASHILVKVAPDADDKAKAEARMKIEKIRQRVTGGEDFAKVASETSEGPSAPTGGDLGFFGKGQMVPAFEKAAFSLAQGGISDVVETQFGYHIILCTGRKPGKVTSFEEAKGDIREFLAGQIAEKDIGAFIEGLKGTAKIERN